jgi:hypothetical protein
MAAGQLSLARRALLAACAAPALAPAGALGRPGPASDAVVEDLAAADLLCPDDPIEDAWDYAVCHYRVCDAALEAVAHSEDEDLYDRLGARHNDALLALLHTPAPDVAALAMKIDLALDERSLEYFGDLAGLRTSRKTLGGFPEAAAAACLRRRREGTAPGKVAVPARQPHGLRPAAARFAHGCRPAPTRHRPPTDRALRTLEAAFRAAGSPVETRRA